MRLTDLPQDILLAIYIYITPQDLLALNQVFAWLGVEVSQAYRDRFQTCRTLHALGTADYVWHQLKIDLPLAIDQKTPAGNYRPFNEIRHSLIDAFRVEANWGSKCTKIRRLTRVFHGDILIRVQLLREDWLVTLSRNHTTDTTYLSAWYLGRNGDEARCAAKVEVARRSCKFAAAVQEDGDRAVIALFNNYRVSGGVEMFCLSLTDDYAFEDTPVSPLKRVAEISYTDKHAQNYDYLDHRGMFVEVQANNNIIAVSVIRINKAGPPLTYQIILVSVDTLDVVVLQKTILEDVSGSRFTFKLFPDHVAILFAKYSKGSLYWQAIGEVLGLGDSPCTNAFRSTAITDFLVGAAPITFFMDRLPILDIDSLPPIHTCELFGLGNDVTFTAEMIRATQDTLTMITCGQEKVWVFRLTIPAPTYRSLNSALSLELTATLTLKSDSYVENFALGRTGHRMVLLQHSWETDEYKLTKVTLPMPGRRDVIIHDLIPPHIALPFQFHLCIHIWFEEATGRICFGLHTGEVYLLEV